MQTNLPGQHALQPKTKIQKSIFLHANKNSGSARGGKTGPPLAEIRRGEMSAKIGVLRGHQASHDLWGQKNCSRSRRQQQLCH